ncbi:MAG: hypothetical protein ACJAZR_002663 [Sediminicola sp.]|jgi:hypothetical protein
MKVNESYAKIIAKSLAGSNNSFCFQVKFPLSSLNLQQQWKS